MERDFGSYTLQCKAILQRRHGIAEYERAMNGDSPTLSGGETAAQFRDRVRDFFDNELVPALRRGEKVCVVSHKYVVELICQFILGRSDRASYDLRLPNSQMLRGDRIHRYVRNENRHRDMAYDWIVVNHPLVFCAGLVAGLLGNVLGIRLPTSPYLLLSLLILASVITMCRIELERARDFLTDRGIVRSVLLRYALLPTGVAALLWWLQPAESSNLVSAAILVATPSSVVAMTVSRCLGGMIMPTFAHVVLSSAAAVIGFSAVLWAAVRHHTLAAVTISAVASTGIVLAAYLLVRQLRQRSPIRTAKFGERNGYVAVLLLTAFVVLVTERIDLASFTTYGPAAIAVAVGLRLVAILLRRRRHVQGLDDYIAMTYPNVFVVVIIAVLTGNTALEHVAIWCLLPMFVLSFFDSWHAKFVVVAAEDNRWLDVLGIPTRTAPARSAHT